MTKALLIIDVQNAFEDPLWGKRNNVNAEDIIKDFLNLWRKTEYEVIFIQHVSKNPRSLFYPDKQGFQMKEVVKPNDNEIIIRKEFNSAFIDTPLESYLKNAGIEELVITGLTTPHCVSTTTRMSGNLGFNTFVLSDATAAFGLLDHNGAYIDAQTIHDISLATVHNEFATVLTSNDYIRKHL